MATSSTSDLRADAQGVFEREYAQANPLRLSSTNLQNYHEIIAISEGSLNSVLKLRYSTNLKKNKDRRLREFKHAIPQFGSIDGTLSAPHIQMVVDKAPQSVRFYVNFESGSFEYWLGQGPYAELKSQDIAGWSIAFNIDFSLQKLASVPTAIRDQVTLLHPEHYSVSEIVLGLSAASLASVDWTHSTRPGLSQDQDTEIIQLDGFKRYFEMYIDWLSRGPYSVLGYAIEVHKATSEGTELMPASFPPTSVQCITQAYVPCTDDFRDVFPTYDITTVSKQSRGGLDALVFLEMTNFAGWPGTFYDSATAGNWITGTVSSSLALSKLVFWDGFLMKKFSALNMQILALANDMFSWVMWSKRVYPNPWKVDQAAKPDSAPWESTPDGAKYSWSGLYNDKDGSDYDKTVTKIDNVMRWMPGTEFVKVDVQITQARSYNQSSKSEFDMGYSFTQNTSLTWSLVLRLNTIKAGELETVVSYDQPKLTSNRSDSQAFWHGDLVKKYEQDVIDRIKAELNTSAIHSEVSGVLNDKGRFVFPGAGDFNMSDPAFNPRGDLLVKLDLVPGQLPIDDDFHLQVAAPNQDFHGQYVKVEKDGDDAAWVLVADKQQATLFQTSNDELRVDVASTLR